jgi:hypothetical protein
MNDSTEAPAPTAASSTPGGNLRTQVEATGIALAEAYTALLGSLPEHRSGPQALSDLLGITVVTASRLLRAIAQPDPIAVVEQIPGVVPLRKVLKAAGTNSAPVGRIKAAAKAVDSFERLIRKNAGHRSSLNAMLTDWLPNGRREFEVRRRQAVFKAISELRGVSCELDLATIALHPSEEEGLVDLLSIQGNFGLDRIRPDATVQFGTVRTVSADEPENIALDSVPAPRTLYGQPITDGMNSVRLDQFCSRAPAPLEAKSFGREIQYLLAETGFGPDSSVDLVIAEVNRAELKQAPAKPGDHPRYFFQIPSTPCRAMLFDVFIHKSIYTDREPQLMVYDTCTRGPAAAGSPERAVDLQHTSEDLQLLGDRPSRRRYAGFPRYLELLDHSFEQLKWNSGDFNGYRIQISYPLIGQQICIAFYPKN